MHVDIIILYVFPSLDKCSQLYATKNMIPMIICSIHQTISADWGEIDSINARGLKILIVSVVIGKQCNCRRKDGFEG